MARTGSLLPEEMAIPFICLTHDRERRMMMKRDLGPSGSPGSGKAARHGDGTPNGPADADGATRPAEREVQERMHAVRLARLRQEQAAASAHGRL